MTGALAFVWPLHYGWSITGALAFVWLLHYEWSISVAFALRAFVDIPIYGI